MADGGSYSLWVMPTGRLAQQLQQQIDSISADCGAPVFEPHVTLIGGVHRPEAEVLSVAADLAARLQPYQLQFQDVHFGAIFHQCVYIRIQPQPHVMHAGAETRAAYGGDRDATYMPHLSLLYSDIDEDARRTLAEQQQDRCLLRRWLAFLRLLCAHCKTFRRNYRYEAPCTVPLEPGLPCHRRLMQRDDSPLTERSFSANELHVWYTEEQDPTLKSWRRVGRFALTGTA